MNRGSLGWTVCYKLLQLLKKNLRNSLDPIDLDNTLRITKLCPECDDNYLIMCVMMWHVHTMASTLEVVAKGCGRGAQ